MDTASALLNFLDLDWLRQPVDKGPGSLDWGTIQLRVYTAPPVTAGAPGLVHMGSLETKS